MTMSNVKDVKNYHQTTLPAKPQMLAGEHNKA